MPTLNESLTLVKQLRADNPQLDSLNDAELADIVYKQTGDERLAPVAKSSYLGRGIAKVGMAANDLGQQAENVIAGENPSYERKVAGRVVSNLISSSPEMVIGALSARAPGIGKLAGLTGLGGFSYGRTMAETGDTTAAAGSAASSILGVLTAELGGNLAEELVGPAAKPLVKTVAGAAGSVIGSVPSDALEIATAPGDAVQNLKNYFGDPVDAPAYLLTNIVSDPIMHAAGKLEMAAKERIQKIKQQAPDSEKFVSEDDAAELARLHKKPVAEQTDMDIARIRELSTRLNKQDETILARQMANKASLTSEQFAQTAEVPATLKAQIRMLLNQKKAVVEVPKGSALPPLRVDETVFDSHIGSNGNSYYYDSRLIKPEQIEQAIKTNTLGSILGYGTNSVPQGLAQTAAVIRSKYGVEKVAVSVDNTNQASVLESLKKMSSPDDVVQIEPISAVLRWRIKNRGLENVHSISRGMRNTRRNVAFANRLLDQFSQAFQPKIKGFRQTGPRFQVDANGEISGNGLMKALTQWAPPEMMEHYKSQGLDQFLNPVSTNKTLGMTNKVKMQDFVQWLRQNTPEVEVKKLVPGQFDELGRKAAEAQHVLETAQLEFVPSTDEAFTSSEAKIQDADGNEVDLRNLGPVQRAAAEFFFNHEDRWGANNMEDLRGVSDAATGRYGVEPVKVEEMDRPVDMLVRVPHKENFDFAKIGDYNERSNEHGVLYRGPHFGGSDINVLASIRGYFPNPDSFFAFEIQSDWGQRVAKLKQNDKDLGPGQDREIKNINHPLLSSYETLAVKTAIQHALRNGATKLILPDAETAMMTEGHDHNKVFEGPVEIVGQIARRTERKIAIPQENGMRQHYDNNLVNIARKLTGAKPERVNLGEFTNREASKVFNGKKTITGYSFDLMNVKPEVHHLFAMYDMDNQLSYEDAIDQARNERLGNNESAEKVTPKQMLERAIKGDKRVELDALAKFYDGLVKQMPELFDVNINNPEVIAHTNLVRREIKMNRNNDLTLAQMHQTLAHELTHVALQDIALTEPHVYEALMANVTSMSLDDVKNLFDDLKKHYDMGATFDTDYLSGKYFDPKEVDFKDKRVHEFVSGISEVLAKISYNQNTMPEWLNFLPLPVVRVLTKLALKFKQHFGLGYPSMTHMLPAPVMQKLSRSFDLMNNSVFKSSQLNTDAMVRLSATDAFDENTLINRLPQFNQDLRQGVSKFTGGDGTMMKFARKLAEDGNVKKPETNWFGKKFQDLFFSGLFRTRIRPETTDFFFTLHNVRPNIQADEYSFLASLGQNDTNTLGRQQALENTTKFIDGLVSTKRGEFVKDAFSKVIEENQNRREKALKDGAPMVTWEQLVTKGEMMDTYKLSEEEANFLDRLVRVPELVAQRSHQLAQQTDNVAVTKLFYRANKKQDLNMVRQKVDSFNRTVNDFGAKRNELDSYRKALKREQSLPDPDPSTVGELQGAIHQLETEEINYKTLLDQSIRDAFSDSIVFKPEKDNFISAVSELMVNLASIRVRDQFMTKDAGYAPMTRRGRFLLRVFDNTELGDEFKRVREFKGFETEKELNNYLKEQGLTRDQPGVEIIDKETLKSRAMAYSPERLKDVRDKAKAQLQDMIRAVADQTVEMEPDQREVLLNTLNELEASYRPLEDEIKEVIALRGDKFKERRYLVPGFDRNDFIPNIIEYMNYKTVSAHKRLARMEADLQIERPEFDNDPDMKNRMRQETNYVLSNQDEWNAFRKATFYYYLGGSLRHVAQNAVQIPLNGISQLASAGYGFRAYKFFMEGASLAGKYAMKGTTGDERLDALLKQAEKDELLSPISLDTPVMENVELQNALDSVSTGLSGTSQMGKKIGLAGSRVMKTFEKFLQSTSTASERANRSATFIASILAQRSSGINDVRSQYGEASKFTDYVNFIGDKTNRPGYLIKHGGTPMHGPLLVWSSLQSFTINHISQLYAFWKRAQGGSKADKQALAIGAAHLLALSGSMGLIGAATAEQLFEEFTGVSLATAVRTGLVKSLTSMVGDEDKEGMAHAADRVADTALYGLPALAGAEVSGNIGLGSPFIRYQSGRPMELLDATGAGPAMLGRVATGAKEIGSDPFNPQAWFSAARTASPAFLTNTLRSYDVIAKGTSLDKNMQPASGPLDFGNSMAAFIGLTPIEVSKERAFKSQDYKNTKKMSDDYERTNRQIANLLQEFEQSGNPELLLRANNLFSNFLDSTGGLQDRDAMVDSITTQLEEARGKTMQPATLKGSAARQSLELAFPSVVSQQPSRLSSAFDELKVAQLLGQDDVLYRKMLSLPTKARSRVITDLLISAGVRPEEVSQFLQPSSAARLGQLPRTEM